MSHTCNTKLFLIFNLYYSMYEHISHIKKRANNLMHKFSFYDKGCLFLMKKLFLNTHILWNRQKN